MRAAAVRRPAAVPSTALVPASATAAGRCACRRPA